jgi:hypothetical protein
MTRAITGFAMVVLTVPVWLSPLTTMICAGARWSPVSVNSTGGRLPTTAVTRIVPVLPIRTTTVASPRLLVVDVAGVIVPVPCTTLHDTVTPLAGCPAPLSTITPSGCATSVPTDACWPSPEIIATTAGAAIPVGESPPPLHETRAAPSTRGSAARIARNFIGRRSEVGPRCHPVRSASRVGRASGERRAE